MEDDQRIHPSKVAGDRASLTSFLDYQRATLAMKCAGLTGEQLKRRAVPTSGLTLLGLVRHAASVERSWFRVVVNAEDVKVPWPGEVDGTFGEFHVEDADVDEAFGVWREECDRARAVVASFGSLDDTVDFRGETISLRYVLTHMIEEYARHNGHADLLREAIDGAVGE
ncbi:DinB family protein [Streptomyces sp. NPDC053493]|uniref:DinB family protein n=1 Tax=Streptomyces sp. NPDC053493 TaxID=3365705 RepID=UPI0037CF1ABA